MDDMMLDHPAGINVGQSFQGQLVSFLFLGKPGNQRLPNNPPTRALQAAGDFIYLFGQR
jgi:hypothetical protein